MIVLQIIAQTLGLIIGSLLAGILLWRLSFNLSKPGKSCYRAAGARGRSPAGFARGMAAYISPRPGCALHPLTIQAATHMTDLIERAIHFQGLSPS